MSRRVLDRLEKEIIRVAVVDDQQLVRAGFTIMVQAQQDMEVVGEAENGAGAVRLSRELRPDVMLMDVRMPGLNGVDATSRIVREPGNVTRVLVLTTFDLDESTPRSRQEPAASCSRTLHRRRWPTQSEVSPQEKRPSRRPCWNDSSPPTLALPSRLTRPDWPR
jgi:CheY-like chemotaxis protein